MNTKHIIAPLLLVSLFTPSSVFAQASVDASLTTTVNVTSPTTTPSPTGKPWLFGQIRQLRKEVREEVKDNRQEVKEDVKEMRQEIKNTPPADRLDARKKILTTSQNGLLNSFRVRATALEKYQKMIVDRIAQKLVKFPGNQDLLKAQASLSGDEQKSLWANFNASVAKYEASIKLIASSDNPKGLLSDLRTQAKKVHEDLKAIRQMLVVNLRLTVRAK